MPESTPRKKKSRSRKREFVILAIVILLLFGGMLYRSRLSSIERKLIGVWTWEDAPGEMVVHYRSDRTMRYDWAPFNQKPAFVRWNTEGDQLVHEYSYRSTLKNTLFNKVLQSPAMQEHYPLRFLEEGSVEVEMEDGTTKILIPWDGAMSQEIQTAK